MGEDGDARTTEDLLGSLPDYVEQKKKEEADTLQTETDAEGTGADNETGGDLSGDLDDLSPPADFSPPDGDDEDDSSDIVTDSEMEENEDGSKGSNDEEN